MKKIIRTMEDFHNTEIDFHQSSNISGGTDNTPHDLFAGHAEPYGLVDPEEDELG